MVRNMKNEESLKTKILTSSNMPIFKLKCVKSNQGRSNPYAVY